VPARCIIFGLLLFDCVTLELRRLEIGRMSSGGPFTATWDIRLIHARGVACASITLP
jgi:hypothetical protein